jgi:alpha-tubulin suppressor-like RCC1 family protein
MTGIRLRGVAAGHSHTLTLRWDGRVYSRGDSLVGELGHGDKLAKPSPALVEGLESVHSIAASG